MFGESVELYTYIIVDDEIIIRQGFIAKVSQATALPMKCAGEASNGIEALELIAKARPDIVITDMKMSGMDGMEFLEKLNQQYPQIPVIVISGYKLFDYVRQAIEKHAVGYVLKPFSSEEIAEQIKKAIGQLESQNHVIQLQQEVGLFEEKKKQEAFINALLYPWTEDTKASFLANGYQLEWEYLLLTITTNRQDLVYHLKELCRDSGGLFHPYLLENPLDKFQSLALLHCPKGERNLSNAAELLAAEVSGLAGDGHLIICISRPIRKAKDLHALFQENNEILKNIHLTGRVHILHDKEQSEVKTFLSEEEIQDMFMDMKYHTGKTLDLLKSFFESIDPQKYSLGAIQEVCKSLLEKVNEYAAQNQVEVCDLTESFYRKYLFCDSIEVIRADFTAYINAALNAVHLKKKGQENLLWSMKDYIDKNYRRKLTLQMISSRFYVSPACCSTLLKENLNMTFNDYINDIRLQRAKQLLSETSLSVNKISDEVGYSNPKYFFKIFKIYSGSTPLEYRSQNSYGMNESIKH